MITINTYEYPIRYIYIYIHFKYITAHCVIHGVTVVWSSPHVERLVSCLMPENVLAVLGCTIVTPANRFGHLIVAVLKQLGARLLD